MHPHKTIDLEACKILWNHKSIFFAFAALPILLDVTGASLSNQEFMNVSNTTIAQICMILKWLVALPLFAFAWVRHLLNPSYALGVKSYFQIDIQIALYILYSLLIFSLCLAWDYVYIYLDLKHEALSLIALTAQYYYIILPLIILGIMIPFYFSLHSLLILPFVADTTPITMANIFKKFAPYRRGFSWEMIAWLFLFLYIPNKVQSLGMDLIEYGSRITRIQPGLLIVLLYILKFILVYALMAIILNFVTLFYTQCIKNTKPPE